MKIKRFIVIVLDSAGIGFSPDADRFADVGSNTLCNTAKAVGGLNMQNMQAMGLGNIAEILGVPAAEHPLAVYGKMAEESAGKDTLTGHWELMGLCSKKPFPVYPNGFPKHIIKAFEDQIGKKVLGNKAASGTVIIEELGPEHIKTGYPIVYTSADSVFQIAAHKDIIPLGELYNMCVIARKIFDSPDNRVARVIARPFIGTPGAFIRTHQRRDFSLEPNGQTVLDSLQKASMTVFAVGKIHDIFSGRGISASVHVKDNMDAVDKTVDAMRKIEGEGMIFANLSDFDVKYGHRNDPKGYADALSMFDSRVPDILDAMNRDDILVITADHGTDPTSMDTDHTREYVPILITVKSGLNCNKSEDLNLGIRGSFADLGATIADIMGADLPPFGKSFKNFLLAKI